MRIPISKDVSAFWRKFSVAFLACFTVSGLVLGAWIASRAGDEVLALMRTVPSHSMSIVGLLAVMGLPIFLSFFAVRFGHSWLLIPICFFQAFLWSYCGLLCVRAFGSAGWLVQLLLMFSSGSGLPVLLLFSLRYISGERILTRRDCFLCLTAAAVIGWLDCCVISPYLAMLIA